MGEAKWTGAPLTARTRQDPNSRPVDSQEQLLPHQHWIFRPAHTRYKHEEKVHRKNTLHSQWTSSNWPMRRRNQFQLPHQINTGCCSSCQKIGSLLLCLSEREQTKNHEGRTPIRASRSMSRKIRSRESGLWKIGVTGQSWPGLGAALQLGEVFALFTGEDLWHPGTLAKSSSSTHLLGRARRVNTERINLPHMQRENDNKEPKSFRSGGGELKTGWPTHEELIQQHS
jgi:hypothetical protein